jgi:cytoskeleton protein RodZ
MKSILIGFSAVLDDSQSSTVIPVSRVLKGGESEDSAPHCTFDLACLMMIGPKSRIATIANPEETGLPSFGEKLKLEREKRKMTLEEISSSTKIGTRMLQALEEEKFNQLPGGIFNKGFVRAYARMVGLDEDQAVADYLQASGEALPKPDSAGRDTGRENTTREDEERISRLDAISDSPSRPMPWGVFAVVLLVIALALSLWSHRRREQEREATHTPAPVKQTSASPSKESPAAGASAIQPAPGGAAVNPLPAGPISGGKTPSPADRQTPVPVTQAGDTTSAAGEFTVVVKAREQSWVSITVDGKASPSEIMNPSSERTLHGQKEIKIKAGNAAGLDFLLNGKKLAVSGEPGQVKSVTIGPAGLSPNAAN